MATPESPDTARILYKYTDRNGAEKILSNRTLRFTKPSEMNDPFDVYIEDLFGVDLNEFFEASGTALFDTLLSNPQQYAAACHVDPDEANHKAEWLRNLPSSERAAWRECFKMADLAKIDPGFAQIRASLEAERDKFLERFKKHGICAQPQPTPTCSCGHITQTSIGEPFWGSSQTLIRTRS
jgi:hypothetical protein